MKITYSPILAIYNWFISRIYRCMKEGGGYGEMEIEELPALRK